MRRGRALLGIVAMVAASLGLIGSSDAAGPWRGQVVNAETGEPLEGVVVLAVWDKISPGVMHPRREYHDVDEVVTGAEGRFAIPARHVLTANPFVSLDGPNLHMFKAGYGTWRKRGIPPFTLNRDEVRKLMEKEGIVFELPALRSREERLNALPSRPSGVSETRIPRFMEALDGERIYLGLTPFGKRKDGGRP
jgi:hypothetical protein